MKQIKQNMLGLLALLAGFAAEAQTADTSINLQNLTVQKAQEIALQRNASVVNSRLDVESAKKKIWETTAIGLPQVNATVTYQYNPSPAVLAMQDNSGVITVAVDKANGETAKGNPTTASQMLNQLYTSGQYKDFVRNVDMPMGTKNSATWDLTVSQLIFSGEYIVGLQASRTYLKMSEDAIKKQEQSTKETIANAYYLVLISQESKQYLDSSVVLLERSAKETEQAYKVGLVQDIVADQLNLNLATLKNNVITLDNQIILAQRMLKFNMGVPLDQPVTFGESLNSLVSNASLTVDTNTLAVENLIDYQMLSTQESLMKLSYRRAQSKALPTLAAFYRHKDYITTAPALLFEPKNLIGVTLSIPIFSSGQRCMQVAEAKIDYRKVQNSKAQASEGLKLQALQAKSDYQTAVMKFETEKKNLVLAKKIFEKNIISHRAGVASSTDLTQAQSQFIQTQSNYATATFQMLNAKLKLDKATGKL